MASATMPQGKEPKIILSFKVNKTVAYFAVSADGDGFYEVEEREFSQPWVKFTPFISNFISTEGSESCILYALSQLQIPSEEVRRYYRSDYAELTCNATRVARERGIIPLVIEFEINYSIDQLLGDEELIELENSRRGSGAVPSTDAEIAMALKTIVFKKDRGNAKYCDCIICLYEFLDDTQVCQLPCLRIFHGACIVKWLRESNCCPICRFEIQDYSA